VFDRLPFRWLALALVVVALLAGGGYAYWRWTQQPPQLLAAAQNYYDRGEAARAREQPAEARRNYELANEQIHTLFTRYPEQQTAPAMLLRARVLGQLAPLVAEKEQAAELARLAFGSAGQAAYLDPSNAEAQARMMTSYVLAGQLEKAGPYASRLCHLKTEADVDANWATLLSDLAMARFVLAWMAMHHYSPPKPTEALGHLRRLDELEARIRGGAAKVPPPRWRAVALEARALALQADQARNAAATRDQAKEARAALEALRGKLSDWLARMHAEKEEPLPAVPVTLPPTVHTVASLAVRSSPTDVPGVFEVLTIGVQQAATPAQVLERTDLATAVCEKLTSSEHTPELVLREASRFLAGLPDLALRRTSYLMQVEKHPGPALPRFVAWAGVRGRIDKLSEAVLERTPADGRPQQALAQKAEAYLGLARTAQREGREEAALHFVGRGLDNLDRARKAGAADADVGWKAAAVKIEAGLNAVGGWACVVLGRPADAGKYLAALRRNPDKALAGQAHLIAGLVALEEGRPEDAVRELEQGRRYNRVGDTLYPYLGLAVAYRCTGRYDRALATLEKVRTAYERSERLTDEEKLLAERLLPEPNGVHLEVFRCLLGLGNVREALPFKEALKNTPEGRTAAFLLVEHYVGLLRGGRTAGRVEDVVSFYQPTARTRTGAAPANPSAAVWDAARQELQAAQEAAPDDTRLVLAEAEPLLSPPAASPANEKKVEQMLAARGADGKDVTAALAWARWLELHGRATEADALLGRLETSAAPAQRLHAQAQRAALRLATSQPGELGRLLRLLELERPADLEAEVLATGYVSGMLSRPPASRGESSDPGGAAKAWHPARYDADGLAQYEQGLVAQARGDHRQAVQSYERSMQYAALRTASLRGLLGSVYGLAEREGPAAASGVIGELLQAHPGEPVLLLTFADTAVQLDNVSGNQGMEGALRALEAALRDQQYNPALGPYFLARGWKAAGREDLARREIERALQADARHQPTLLLACELTAAAGDWERCLECARTLEGLGTDLPRAIGWRARALENLGLPAEALKAYQELAERFPDRSAGYLGLAAAQEAARDYGGALSWVGLWRNRAPEDLAGLQAQVRLLARAGRGQEAEALAEKVLTEAKTAEPKQERAAAFAQAFLAGQALDRAEAWGRRAVTLAASLPEARRQAAVVEAELLLADVYLKRGQRDRALDAYKAAYEKSPGHPTAGAQLARLLCQERGEAEAAFAVVQQVRQGRYSRKPISGDRWPLDLLETFGLVYREARHYKEAVELFGEAARRYGDEPRVYLQLGRSYGGLKQFRAALDNLNKAARMATDKADAARDPQRKAQLLAVAAEANKERQRLVGQVR
jgi:hypothetical protein